MIVSDAFSPAYASNCAKPCWQQLKACSPAHSTLADFPANDPEMLFANHSGLSGTSEVVTLKLLNPYLASRSSTALGVRDSCAPGPHTTSEIGSSLPSFGRSST
jgi:hypothetical protein